jgi:hypothetical protein
MTTNNVCSKLSFYIEAWVQSHPKADGLIASAEDPPSDLGDPISFGPSADLEDPCDQVEAGGACGNPQGPCAPP